MDQTTAKPCDSCRAAPSALFCRADSAFLCAACDARLHAANNIAARHARVLLCEVCEHAPAAVTCKADAAALCHACDRDIHSANPLARRHERLPVVPFYDSADARPPSRSSAEFSEEEAEAASWLLPDPNSKPERDPDPEYNSNSNSNSSADTEYLFADPDSETGAQKQSQCQLTVAEEHKQYYSTDGVVPVQHEGVYGSGQYPGPVVDGYPTYDVDYHPVSKPFMYNFTSQSISHSVSSEVGVVPDHNAVADMSNGLAKSEAIPTPLSGVDREARVLRYRQKRKNRKFAKTIRYASRKAYAETRPRIKGRFAKRSELEIDSLFANDASSYGVVPTYFPAVAN